MKRTLPKSPYFEDLSKAEPLCKAQDMAKALDLNQSLLSLRGCAGKAKSRDQIAKTLCHVAMVCERVFRNRPPTEREVMEYGIGLFFEADNAESVDLLPLALEYAVNEQWLRRWQGCLEVTEGFRERCERLTKHAVNRGEGSKVERQGARKASAPKWLPKAREQFRKSKGGKSDHKIAEVCGVDASTLSRCRLWQDWKAKYRRKKNIAPKS